MGAVYKAEYIKLKRTGSLKLPPTELTPDREVKKRFIRRARAPSAMQKNNILKIHETDEDRAGNFLIRNAGKVSGSGRGTPKDGGCLILALT